MREFFAVITASQLVLVPILALGLYGAFAYFARSKKDTSSDPNRVNWGPLQSVGITLAIYLMAQVAGALLLAVYFGITGLPMDQANTLLRESTSLQFGFILCVDGITLALISFLLRRRRTAWSAIGFVRPRWLDVPYAVIGFIVYMVVYIGVTMIVSWLFPDINLKQQQDVGFNTAAQGWGLLPIFLSLVILPPIVEEMLARGVLYSGLRTRLKMVVAAVITSVIFASAHLPGSKDGALLWVGAIDTFILSMVLVYLREKRASLWPPIYVHAMKNGLAFIVLFIVHLPV